MPSAVSAERSVSLPAQLARKLAWTSSLLRAMAASARVLHLVNNAEFKRRRAARIICLRSLAFGNGRQIPSRQSNHVDSRAR
jgi:hypothetical protein